MPDILILIVTTGLTLGLEHRVGLVGLHLPEVHIQGARLGLGITRVAATSLVVAFSSVPQTTPLSPLLVLLVTSFTFFYNHGGVLIVGVALQVRLGDVQLVGLLAGTAIGWAAGCFFLLQGILGIE